MRGDFGLLVTKRQLTTLRFLANPSLIHRPRHQIFIVHQYLQYLLPKRVHILFESSSLVHRNYLTIIQSRFTTSANRLWSWLPQNPTFGLSLVKILIEHDWLSCKPLCPLLILGIMHIRVWLHTRPLDWPEDNRFGNEAEQILDAHRWFIQPHIVGPATLRGNISSHQHPFINLERSPSLIVNNSIT